MNKSEFFFKYCPSCGSVPMHKRDDDSIECPHCGFHYYFNAAAAVAGLILDDQDRLLVTVRKREPGKGMLDLPGGFVDAGESAEDALIREINEELDISLDHVEYLVSFPNTYFYKGITYNTLDMAYICTTQESHKARALDDVQQVLFLEPEEINLDDFAFKSVKNIINCFLDNMMGIKG